MNQSALTSEIKAIWRAGVDAVMPQNLIRNRLSVQDSNLCFRSETGQLEPLIELHETRRLLVVGAGKASAAMAEALDQDILGELQHRLPELTIDGWINCPEQPDLPNLTPSGIRLFQARPAGMNSPTPRAIEGTQQILSLVQDAAPHDVVICLLSGGGSALLTAPAVGLTLEDKQSVARRVAAAGANIEQLNCVRRAISLVKGGGLARQCRAGRLATLIISDVLGDSLETIASGPTCLLSTVDPREAFRVLTELDLLQDPALETVVQFLQKESAQPIQLDADHQAGPEVDASPATQITHSILGNNAEAVEKARLEAESRGYQCVTASANQCEGDVAELADEAVARVQANLATDMPTCLITGGEPTVTLPPSPGKGGRNQQLTGEVLARVLSQLESGTEFSVANRDLTIGFLSGGTDGEDGPTDAAGAYFCGTIRELRQTGDRRLARLRDSLAKAATYDYFGEQGTLLKSGPTGTNVCDLRVTLIVPPGLGS